MILKKHHTPLELVDIPIPKPAKGELLLQIHACGICRTDLHVIDGELPNPVLPIIPGHQIVGTIVEKGSETTLPCGLRVGVPWLGNCCHHCKYCLEGSENLCDQASYTGFQINGGFADYCLANEGFCFPLPLNYSDEQVAPLLCAGLIGHRAHRFAGNAKNLGIYGFGSAAHILIQVARFKGQDVFAFTREGDKSGQDFAYELGAKWCGSSNDLPPIRLDAAIIFAPIGELVPKALRATTKAGIVICAGIHMSDIPSFPYEIIWEERILRSVANLTRQDGVEFLALAPIIPIQTSIKTYPLENINQALTDLRSGNFHGSGVVLMSEKLP